MSPINFSVAKEIISKLRDTDNELFREEFDDFMSQISRRIKDIITEDKASLANIINTLKNDSVSKSEDRQFLIDMG
jgi:HSP90 family molecular chaperone